MRILIIGASIPGLCATWWFRQAGHRVTLVDPRPILDECEEPADLFGDALRVVESMGVASELAQLVRPADRASMQSAAGIELFSVDLARAKRRLYGDRTMTVSRADLCRLLFRCVGGDEAIEFGRIPLALRDDPLQTFVLFDDGAGAGYDLVIGAGGLRSPTRRLITPAGAIRETDIGVDLGWAIVRPDADEPATTRAISIQEAPGRQVVISPLHDGRVIARFALHRPAHQASVPVSSEVMVRAFRDFGGRVPAILDAVGSLGLRVEAAIQQELPVWHRGRVTLVGDASHASSVLAVQRTALEIRAARHLVRLVASGGRHPGAALRRFEWDMRPQFVRADRTAREVARWLAPPQGLTAALRDLILCESATTVGALVARRALYLTPPS